MLHEMRRKDKLLSAEDAAKILDNGVYGVLSTIGEDGYPYGVPVNFVCTNDVIYFHCAAGKGHKLENISYNNHVCFTVIGSSNVIPEKLTTNFASAIVFGTAAQVTDDDEKSAALMSIVEKYAPEHIEAGKKSVEMKLKITDIYKITIDQLSGKASR